MAYKFRLQKVLDVKEKEEDNKKNEMSLVNFEIEKAKKQLTELYDELEENYIGKKSQLEGLNKGALISETEYRNLPEEYDELIEVGMGASAVKALLDEIDLPKLLP